MLICSQKSRNAPFLNLTVGECSEIPIQFDRLTTAIPRDCLLMTFSDDVIWEVDISKSLAEFKVIA